MCYKIVEDTFIKIIKNIQTYLTLTTYIFINYLITMLIS